ncbi:hypothetical protein OG312_09560 [Kocuria rhizophila]|uniref:hypothetical protein n=1 Tax=Kocuria TaxID=57493 RepID=UPI00057F0565|nr:MULTISPECIES: hypothetical protein [Kocuria]OFK06654.1 hypothetical protein HMPREF2833_04280 [Kocuria sp. HMSC066H03]HAG64010.1 hypothetical protein [Kocuria sp.]KIC68009.1 hypothetical protein RK09_07375 [Kocuria rhizophila]PKZ38659.1 hypothetical protein CYJ75_05880 [Kocuria rhizophila]WSQ04645.1 hypothetical protein OG312_09560 [Kocuria rhizophila]
MAFDWEQFKANVQGEAEWQDADDLARMSIETLRAEHGLLRRDASSGSLRLTGPGITIHSGAIDGIADTLRNFQRLVLATGLAVKGHKSLRGQPPADVVSKTRLNLNGSPLPGSLILQIVPTTLPADEISPDGQVGLFGDDNAEPQLIDTAMKRALGLLEDGRRLGPDADTSDFLARIREYGPRVATTLRDFSTGLVKSGFEPDLTWSQPRQARLRTRLSTAELAHIGELIASRELELEPTTIRGIVRTVSEISAWQLEIEDGEIVKIDAKKIPAANTATLRTGMSVSVDVSVTEETGPAGEVKPKYTATSFTVLSNP